MGMGHQPIVLGIGTSCIYWYHWYISLLISLLRSVHPLRWAASQQLWGYHLVLVISRVYWCQMIFSLLNHYCYPPRQSEVLGLSVGSDDKLCVLISLIYVIVDLSSLCPPTGVVGWAASQHCRGYQLVPVISSVYWYQVLHWRQMRLRRVNHWKPKFVMMLTLSSLAAPVVVMTTAVATNDVKDGIVTWRL